GIERQNPRLEFLYGVPPALVCCFAICFLIREATRWGFHPIDLLSPTLHPRNGKSLTKISRRRILFSRPRSPRPLRLTKGNQLSKMKAMTLPGAMPSERDERVESSTRKDYHEKALPEIQDRSLALCSPRGPFAILRQPCHHLLLVQYRA